MTTELTSLKAHQLLDAARAGAKVSEERITEALIATGDLIDWRPTQRVMEAGTWERRFARFMAPADAFDGLLA